MAANIHIEGYGSITVERSEPQNDEEFADLVGGVVSQVMNLIDPRTQGERFHPVLGIGGYTSNSTRRSA